MDREELRKLIEDDDLGLLVVKPKTSAATADDRLVASFEQINAFFRKSGKPPEANKDDIHEMMLYSRLTGLRADKLKTEALRDFDEFGLLGQPKSISSIEDIFEDDDLGLLDDSAENIFLLKNVPAPKEINLPDYIAKRKPCDDFSRFESQFRQCQADLSAGKRKLMPFSRGSLINKGDYFVLKGVLVYVADEGERHHTADRNTFNARLRCIFENGTESDMLLRSLAAALYKEDGRRVSTHLDKLINKVRGQVSDEDQETGYIYVLKSLSKKPEIESLKNLYKIGFSRSPVEERIKNAAKEPTYLMAPVIVVSAFQCYNLNPHKFELLLHHFFGTACLNVEVIDNNGHRSVPREWFIAPIEIINMAVDLLITGEIVKYRYNPERQQIEENIAEKNRGPSA